MRRLFRRTPKPPNPRVFEGYETDDRPSAIAFCFTSKELLGLLEVAKRYREGKA